MAAETDSQAQTSREHRGRREEYRALANVRDALITEGGKPTAVKARRMGFSRRTLDVFGGVLVAMPSARFRVWLYPQEQALKPEQYLEFSPAERWRIVGVTERVIDGELVSHEVMVDRHVD